MRRGLALGAVGAAVTALLVAGCSKPAEPQPEMLDVDKVGVPTPITSLDWLREECPALADASAVIYYGGYLSSTVDTRLELPGPHTFWRDLVVTLPDGTAAEFVGEYELVSSEEGPDVVPLLEADLPGGVLLRSDEFDDALCEPWHWVEAWVSVETDVVVLTVVDD